MIVVLGSKGLLGSTICKLYPEDTIGLSRDDLDVTDFVALREKLYSLYPDVVINCVGIVPKADQQHCHVTNSILPHVLLEWGMANSVRIIHISTDCVFDGRRGGYLESDPPSATDRYGESKAQGEFCVNDHLTVRTSFVGLPDPNGRGLLSALYSNRGYAMPAHAKVLWSGLTVDSLADILMDIAYDGDVDGIRHIYTPRAVSKAQLLACANEVYNFKVKLVETDYPVCDRTLFSNYNPMWSWPVPIPQQIIRMSQRLSFNG